MHQVSTIEDALVRHGLNEGIANVRAIVADHVTAKSVVAVIATQKNWILLVDVPIDVIVAKEKRKRSANDRDHAIAIVQNGNENVATRIASVTVTVKRRNRNCAKVKLKSKKNPLMVRFKNSVYIYIT